MAAIGTAVLGKSFGRSSVEKAFRPLIDRVEDFFSYTLIIVREVGKIIMEYSIIIFSF